MPKPDARRFGHIQEGHARIIRRGIARKGIDEALLFFARHRGFGRGPPPYRDGARGDRQSAQYRRPHQKPPARRGFSGTQGLPSQRLTISIVFVSSAIELTVAVSPDVSPMRKLRRNWSILR